MNKEVTLARWRRGKEVWNAWAKQILEQRSEIEEAEATADFTGHLFENEEDFRGVVFPGTACFQGVNFFGGAQFSDAIFRGAARFERASFGRDSQFTSATFYGDAWFESATFVGDGRFASATFEAGARFNRAKFVECAWFHCAKFNKFVGFDAATFSGLAHFELAAFGPEADFRNATFAKYAWFNGATFKGNAVFSNASFHAYTSFAHATFAGLADFSAARGERAFTLEATRFAEAPDFIQAHFSEAPRLDNVFIPQVRGVAQILFPDLPGIDAVAGTSARYRALKRLAIEAHDHTRELDYSANELKALRGHPDSLLPCPVNLLRKDQKGRRLPWWPGGLRGAARFWVGLGYEALSDFGRSMVLPLIWWGLAAAGFAWGYLQHAISTDRCAVGPGEPWSAALGLSIRKALPFAGVASSEKLNQIYACLYGIHAGSAAGPGALPERFVPVIPDAVDYLGMVQLVLSLLLLFLFLLAVRNHFRIR